VRIRDISRPLEPGVWVWPGDTSFSSNLAWKMADGASVNVGHITMSCHAGTHMDAPFHFSDSGPTSERIPLHHCIGPCEVLPLSRLAASTAERVLVKAAGGAPSAAEIDGLGRHLLLFGTDGHSVDPMDLTAVPDGRYELIALPLRLVGMDGAPVRAVLVER
jgi:arylformamidase